jgi:NAD(P)H-hydrate epimerase
VKITTAGEMREIDRATKEKYGVPSLTLMENAGTGVADFILQHYPAAKRITVVCGKGNNGGDGFVVARKLHDALRVVEVILLGSPNDVKGDAAAMFAELPVQPLCLDGGEKMSPAALACIEGCDLIADGILGTGFKPPVRGLYADAIVTMNRSGKPVIAVDIPSGADSDSMHTQIGEGIGRADAIVTFTAPRPAHVFGMLTRGPVAVVPIGSPEEAIVSSLNLEVTTPRDLSRLLAPRPMDSNKGVYGHVLVVGGSLGKSGAAAMAGMAALRAGAGLSTVAVPGSVLASVASFAAELMTEPLPETKSGGIDVPALDRVLELATAMSVVALGPGIGRQPETVEFVLELVKRVKRPIVIDADGLNAFQGKMELLDGGQRPLVLTPHPGEMSRLTGLSIKEVQADRLNVARQFAQEHRLVLVLKGNNTIVALPDGQAWVNPTGNPGMATGGTGDILTGMTAGVLAQMPDDVARATIAAVYLHGLAGDIATESMGEHSLAATDLLAGLPEAFRRATRWAGERVVRIRG